MKRALKASHAVTTLFARRLLVVAGKGGVGKTTVACSLGVLASKLGKKTLLAEVDGVGRAAQLLGTPFQPDALPVEARPGLFVVPVDGSAALREYLELIVPIKRALNAVFASRVYQYFVAAAPGLKELMTIGKIWYEAERLDDATGERLWDLVILDAPATGHSLQYLGMPLAAHAVFGSGLVGRESQRLVDLLTDPARTALCLVTTAEEMPVNETIEMYQKVTQDLRIPLGCLFVNRLHATDLRREDAESLCEGMKMVVDADERAALEEVLKRTREELGWAEINRLYLDRLKRAVQIPILEIPYLFSEEFGAPQIREISRCLEERLDGHQVQERPVRRA